MGDLFGMGLGCWTVMCMGQLVPKLASTHHRMELGARNRCLSNSSHYRILILVVIDLLTDSPVHVHRTIFVRGTFFICLRWW